MIGAHSKCHLQNKLRVSSSCLSPYNDLEWFRPFWAKATFSKTYVWRNCKGFLKKSATSESTRSWLKKRKATTQSTALTKVAYWYPQVQVYACCTYCILSILYIMLPCGPCCGTWVFILGHFDVSLPFARRIWIVYSIYSIYYIVTSGIRYLCVHIDIRHSSIMFDR